MKLPELPDELIAAGLAEPLLCAAETCGGGCCLKGIVCDMAEHDCEGHAGGSGPSVLQGGEVWEVWHGLCANEGMCQHVKVEVEGRLGAGLADCPLNELCAPDQPHV